MGNKGSRSSKERASEADQPNPETKLSQNEVTHIWSHWESLKSKRRKLSKQVLTLYLKEHPRAIDLFPYWTGVPHSEVSKLSSFNRKAIDTWEAFSRAWDCIDDPKVCQRVCYAFGKKHIEWNTKLKGTIQIDEHRLKNFIQCFLQVVLSNSHESEVTWKKACDYFLHHFLRGLYDSPQNSIGVEVEVEVGTPNIELPKIGAELRRSPSKRRRSRISNSESCSPQ